MVIVIVIIIVLPLAVTSSTPQQHAPSAQAILIYA